MSLSMCKATARIVELVVQAASQKLVSAVTLCGCQSNDRPVFAAIGFKHVT